MNYKELYKRYEKLRAELEQEGLINKGNYPGVFMAVGRTLAKLAGFTVTRERRKS